jgi:hypothetical protein
MFAWRYLELFRKEEIKPEAIAKFDALGKECVQPVLEKAKELKDTLENQKNTGTRSFF